MAPSEPHRARVVLVTGVSSGIGREVVLEALRRGHRVSGSARRQDRLDALAAEAAAGPGAALPVKQLQLMCADVNDIAACSAWVAAARERFGRIDAIVHNAGYGVQGSIDALSVDDFRAQFETNFFAVVRLTRELLPDLEANRDGDIIMVSSILGHLGLPGRSPYCASKFALEGFAESLRPELRRRGIRVSVVNPGFTATEFGAAAVVRGARPMPGPRAAMPARRVAEEILDCLGRTRRHVLLTALGRAALWARAVAPWLVEWASERSFRGDTRAQGAAPSPEDRPGSR